VGRCQIGQALNVRLQKQKPQRRGGEGIE
jgi:hypothetical protein